MKSTGYILNGKYYKESMPQLTDPEVKTHKGWTHDMQRHEHKRDLIQPYVNNVPNDEFIKAYPKEAKEYGFN